MVAVGIRGVKTGIVLAVAALASTAFAATASAITNSTPITIPLAGNANPYPSTISAADVGTVTKVNVVLHGMSHTAPQDVGVVLVAPNGAALMVMDGAGGFSDITNVTLVFNDTVLGGTELPDNATITSGGYVPTAHFSGDSFPAPGPLTSYGNPGPADGGTATLASAFNGINGNGNWRLFVRDFENQDSGTIAQGWSLELFSAGAAPPGPPNLNSTNPASGSNDNSPRIVGTAPGAATTGVQLFRSANCSGAAEQTVTPAQLAAGASVNVPDNSTTTFTAKSVNVNGSSLCSSPISFTESTPPSTAPTTNPPATPPGQAKKCKKKGSKSASAAKKKCKRKKKK